MRENFGLLHAWVFFFQFSHKLSFFFLFLSTVLQNPTLKYRLPSDPSVWVDLVDDDDVEMMFDEWQEISMATAAASGRRKAHSAPTQSGRAATSVGALELEEPL